MLQFPSIYDIAICCGIGLLAAWLSPFPDLDAGLMVSGVAFGLIALRRDGPPFVYLLRLLVAAYFFRCLVLFLAGNDDVRALAMGNAALGLVGVGAAHLMRSYRRHFDAVSTDAAAETIAPVPEPTSHWSPPQFNLRAIFAATLAAAGLFAISSISGARLAIAVFMVGAVWWLAASLVRFVALSRNAAKPHP